MNDDGESFLMCGPRKGWGHDTTPKKSKVTCKLCMRALGIAPDAISADVTPKKTKGRPTAWDHVLEDDVAEPTPGAPKPEPAPRPPMPTPAPQPTTPQPAPWAGNRTATQRLHHRVALIFFHLMRSHMGVEDVEQIAEMCSRGVTGERSLAFTDLMTRAERLADLIVTPEHERRLSRG